MAGNRAEEEKVLLELLRASISSQNTVDWSEQSYSEDFWKRVIMLAKKHAVLSLLYDTLSEGQFLPKNVMKDVERYSRITVKSNYRLLFLTKYITKLLEQHGIHAITLKGAATASLYPVPELRKSGDIDILITDELLCEKACRLLQEDGYQLAEEQLTLHHVELKNAEGISIEVHGLLAEPFDSQWVNQYLKKLLPEYEANMEENHSWGVKLYQPRDGYHAFYLVLHMLQHFLRSGFGVKNLCDWVVFWNRRVAGEEKKVFTRLIKESKTEGFVKVLTSACVKYLGLEAENVGFMLDENLPEHVIEEFMTEILEAGEFGKAENSRMVAMRGTGFFAYVREFHHQMHLNYPKAGKFWLLWPALWAVTLFRFLYNNYTLRKVSGREILRKARKRSAMVGNMKLFTPSEK